MKQRIKSILCVVCLAAVMHNGAAIYAESHIYVNNHFASDGVQIQIKEYCLDGEKEVSWQGAPAVLPGMKVSKIPRIINYGVECYVRVQLSFEGTKQKTLLETGIYGMDQLWIKGADGYFYYKKTLSPREKVDLFEGIYIPEEFSEKEAGHTFSLRIRAEAIQKESIQPDYSQSSPWGLIKIGGSVHESSYDLALLTSEREEKAKGAKTGEFQQHEIFLFMAVSCLSLILMGVNRRQKLCVDK